MSRLQVLVLGLGFFGKNWLKEISVCPECEVAGVVAKHPDLLTTVAEQFNVPPDRRFGTIEQGLDRSQVQAVIVALPEMIHKAAILAALEKGLHVLTEKPLAMDMAEVANIVRTARQVKDVVVMVDQNYRWRPQNQTLGKAVRDGRIGRVRSVGYEFRQAITRATTDAWREHMPHPYLHDMVVHHFDLIRAITGQDCVEVFARGVRPPWSWYTGLPGVDAILTFEQGLSVSYTGTMVARGFTTPQDGIITLVGENGTLRLEADQQVRCYHDSQVEVISREPMTCTDTTYALREFLAAIRERRRPETHVEDNVRSFAMAAAAIMSVEKKQPVAVTPLVKEALQQ
ncbi:MAG TPA: Gfo/Idh/MocA family oxidoreductase [Candidatus Methylomirabilis sp.]|nr:Gfo/Idh/MocA family oxidoreductase [Candidatus Methylomirabilis sp.]